MKKICILILLFFLFSSAIPAEKVIRIGLIGLDTSHAPAFTKILNDEGDEDHIPGARVVAAFAGGSMDVEASYTRLEKYTSQIRDEFKVEIVGSIAELLPKVDAVIITSVDGRVHLEQARQVFPSKKPLFIDKPMAASLEDVERIFDLAEKVNVSCWSASSLRFYPELLAAIKDTTMGQILGCEAFSPAKLEAHHPDLFWYGIHGVEILFTVMGPDIKSVSRVYTAGADLVSGIWQNGRIGTFRGSREGKGKYGAVLYYENGVKLVEPGKGSLYKPLLAEIIQFFRTGKAPIKPRDTLAIFKFMDAAQKSGALGGQSITIEE
jgi:predicted dehydrogenase